MVKIITLKEFCHTNWGPEKFCVKKMVVVGGGGWCRPILVLSLVPKLNHIRPPLAECEGLVCIFQTSPPRV